MLSLQKTICFKEADRPNYASRLILLILKQERAIGSKGVQDKILLAQSGKNDLPDIRENDYTFVTASIRVNEI